MMASTPPSFPRTFASHIIMTISSAILIQTIKTSLRPSYPSERYNISHYLEECKYPNLPVKSAIGQQANIIFRHSRENKRSAFGFRNISLKTGIHNKLAIKRKYSRKKLTF
jgi:hypothetical protein